MVTVTVMDMAAIPVFGLEKEAVVKEVQARDAYCCSAVELHLCEAPHVRPSLRHV